MKIVEIFLPSGVSFKFDKVPDATTKSIIEWKNDPYNTDMYEADLISHGKKVYLVKEHIAMM
jgi:hypothetical protein